MAGKKKQRKKSKKKVDSSVIVGSEYTSLIVIFVGIFLLYSLNSTSMGMFGDALMIIITILYLATFISAKITEPKRIKK